MGKKLFYIGYYSDAENKSRSGAPAADTKMRYIAESAKKMGYQIEVFSMCSVDTRDTLLKKYKGYCTEQDGVRVRYFDCYDSKNKVLRVLFRFLSRQKIRWYLNKTITASDTVLIYHSLSIMDEYCRIKRKAKQVILEVEEIYSDVLQDLAKKEEEIAALQYADGYIFPTALLSETVNPLKKPEIYIHGTYKVESDRKSSTYKADNAMKHCVYAGTFDPRKGGAIAAAAAAQFLPANYHIHILGFGNETDTREIKRAIADINRNAKAKVSYDGLLSGEEYISFIQSCDIGLSTQNPNAAYNATSFPSKILSYMANGLRVVSIRIPVVETSSVGDKVYYYDVQTPEEIAKAIKNIDFQQKYNSRELIASLDNEFKRNLAELIPIDK